MPSRAQSPGSTCFLLLAISSSSGRGGVGGGEDAVTGEGRFMVAASLAGLVYLGIEVGLYPCSSLKAKSSCLERVWRDSTRDML